MRSLLLSCFLLVACSSSEDAPAGGGAALDRSEKLGAITAADLPPICDAWAAAVGGYGAEPFKKDCGNAFATSRPPTSQADCIQAFEANKSEPTCAATVGGFLDCKTVLHANPCATVGESRACTVFFGSETCKSP